MKKNSKDLFFKPDTRYKQYMILQMISKNPVVTQRELCRSLHMTVSTIHSCLVDYEKEGLIVKKYLNQKMVLYYVTNKGKDKLSQLTTEYYTHSAKAYLSIRKKIIEFFNILVQKGIKRLYLYGINDLTETILRILQDEKFCDIQIVGVVADISIENNDIPYAKLIIKNIKHINNREALLITNAQEKDTILNMFNNSEIIEDKILFL